MTMPTSPDPVLVAVTAEAHDCIKGDTVALTRFPFRVGRESRHGMVHGEVKDLDRRKLDGPPNNDLYMHDRGPVLQVSREQFQIERKDDGSCELVDRGSACGVIVDDHAVGGGDRGGRCPLRDGSFIRVGTRTSKFLFRFQLSGSA